VCAVRPAQVEQCAGVAADGPVGCRCPRPAPARCSRAVLELLASVRPTRLIYVSCDPSTLARDLGVLVRAGYRCGSLRPIDLFPQTFHLESVALLER
jgi:23S rRNA (uracil1939-C5)-methyltransferase